MLDAHIKDHSGRDITMATYPHVAWIANARKLAKQSKSCLRCRFLRKMLEDQQMSSLPASLQVATPPFTNAGFDPIGPITIKVMVNKMAKMKVWIMIFLCLNIKAVCMEVAPGYSTQDFLLAYHSHVSQRGNPSFVHSDRVLPVETYLKIFHGMIEMLSQLQQLNKEPPGSLPQQEHNGGMVPLKYLSRSLSIFPPYVSE